METGSDQVRHSVEIASQPVELANTDRNECRLDGHPMRAHWAGVSEPADRRPAGPDLDRRLIPADDAHPRRLLVESTIP